MPTIREEVEIKETVIGVAVRCDGKVHTGFNCNFRSRLFVDKWQAEQWLKDDDEDYEEYGQFADGVRRVGEVFQRVCGKLYCETCTEKMIQETRSRGRQ